VNATRIAIGLTIIATLVIGAAVRAPQSTAASSGIHNVSAVFGPQDDSTAPAPSVDAEGQRDLSGNDVTDAVATYRLGADGSLYESHSPQTEVPKLGPPKS
jgi:hypothetical protein